MIFIIYLIGVILPPREPRRGNGYISSGAEVSANHTWTRPGTYYVKVMAEDVHGARRSSRVLKVVISKYKPSKPSGQTSGKINEEYEYTASTTDPDEDQLYYLFDWGDGGFSEWIGPLDSGDTAEASHIWTERGDYEIKVKAKDEHGVQSDWSDPLPIEMPRNKPFNIFPPFLRFLEQHSHLFPILRQLLGL